MTSAAAISPKSFTSIVTPWPFLSKLAAITSEKTEGVKPSDPLPVLMNASTRKGSFSRNAEGTLVTPSGYTLQPEIAIPEGVTEINVSADGLVSVQVAGEAEAAEVGQLTLANFANPAGLQPIGENFTVETPASGAPAIGNPFGEGFGKLVQGSLEASNINVVQELVDMIETQRAYEVSSKSISAVDEMMRFVSNNLYHL